MTRHTIWSSMIEPNCERCVAPLRSLKKYSIPMCDEFYWSNWHGAGAIYYHAVYGWNVIDAKTFGQINRLRQCRCNCLLFLAHGCWTSSLPDDFLVPKNGFDVLIKLVDFGATGFFNETGKLQTPRKTIKYSTSEILNANSISVSLSIHRWCRKRYRLVKFFMHMERYQGKLKNLKFTATPKHYLKRHSK